MEQTKALNALEPFLALTKSATSPRAAADLITRATSVPGTYVFAELLQAPQIQALSQSPEYAPYLDVLKIFSYGTYATYNETPNLPALNDQQTLKLRQLSLLSLARTPHSLRYATLQQGLGLGDGDSRALEDLVVSAVYAGLLSAQLDPRNQIVHVSSVAPLRDLAPNALPDILSNLQTWSDRCTSTLQSLEAQIAAIKRAAAASQAEKKARQETTERLMSGDKKFSKPSGSGVHSRGQTDMVNRAVAGVQNKRPFGKRQSGSIEASDEAMDVDHEELPAGEDDDSGSGKKLSRRKL